MLEQWRGAVPAIPRSECRWRSAGIGLAGALSFSHRIESRLVGGAPATAFEHGTLLDGERHVMNVALHLGRGLKRHMLCAHGARYLAAHDDLLARDHAGHFAQLADDDFDGLHV